MNPEDCVLVGVVNRKRDLGRILDEHWYRIPQEQLPRGFHADYLALFLSGGAVNRSQQSGIYYFAKVGGQELRYRRDLLPTEVAHPNADKKYYRIALHDLKPQVPPILNSSRRVITFIYTTWDRFIHAKETGDLYSKSDYFVDRIYYALRHHGIPAFRRWDSEKHPTGLGAGLTIACHNGLIEASTQKTRGMFYLDMSETEDQILAAIRREITHYGGTAMLNIPMEGL